MGSVDGCFSPWTRTRPDHERTGSGSSAECGCHPDVRAPLRDGAALVRILVKCEGAEESLRTTGVATRGCHLHKPCRPWAEAKARARASSPRPRRRRARPRQPWGRPRRRSRPPRRAAPRPCNEPARPRARPPRRPPPARPRPPARRRRPRAPPAEEGAGGLRRRRGRRAARAVLLRQDPRAARAVGVADGKSSPPRRRPWRSSILCSRLAKNLH